MTWLTDTFDLEVPLVAAPMGSVAGGRFAAEVCRNGALGMLAAGTRATPEFITEESEEVRQLGRAWGIGLLAWVVAQRPELVEATARARPRLVSISYGPYADHIELLRAAGCLVTTQVGKIDEARQAEEAGLDFLVVRGSEGGGHGRNLVATMPLLQSVLESTSLPVLAAGGITGRRGLQASLAAGAAGVWVGTPFLGCVENLLPDEARSRVLAAGEGDTIYTNSFDAGLGLVWPPGIGGRALRNRWSQRWHGHEQEIVAADLEQMAQAVGARDYDSAPIWAGESVSTVNRLTTVKEVIDQFR